MTFLVAFVTRKFIVLADDTLVSHSSGPGTPRAAAYDSKIFAVGRRWGVMSHGEGSGEHVPTVIKQIKVAAGASTRDLAEKLMARFSRPPLPRMGLYVAGWDSGRPALFYVDVPQGFIELKKMPNDKRPVRIFFNQFPPDPKEVFGRSGRPPKPLIQSTAIKLARRMVEIVGHDHSDTVGGPTEVLVVRPNGLKWASRLSRIRPRHGSK